MFLSYIYLTIADTHYLAPILIQNELYLYYI